jgi:hypothetical protein
MRSFLARTLSRILIVCMIGLPFSAQAGLIGTDQIVTAEQALAARDMVTGVLSRAEVASQLQALGLTPEAAKDRVAALTDSEVSKLAGQLQNLPAGADGGGLILLILIGVLIWWLVTKR